MIRLRNVTISRGGVDLLTQTDLTVHDGERIALIGANGSGKSTLLAALCDEVVLDAGSIEMTPQRIARLRQSAPGGETPAWELVVQADEELTRARQALDEAQSAGGEALAEAHDRWNELQGHSAAARASELLAGLGFSSEQIAQPASQLSGGWRMRIGLAQALFVPSDLLLLDEPTNHLDLDAIVWLERWLLRYRGTLIVVSHDRDFIDRVAQACVGIEQGRLVRNSGGYSDYELARAQRSEQLERSAGQQAQRIAHLTRFIERFRAKATKARQVQSRIKALERIVQVAPLRAARGLDLSLPEIHDAPDPLLTTDGLVAGYDPQQPIISGVRLALTRGARIGLLGRNGAGKSTLIRTLVGDLPSLGGTLTPARTLRIGYFAQHAVEALREDDTPLSLYRRTWPAQSDPQLRAALGRFGFSDEHALRPIGPMSGGEKARLVLSMVLRDEPHLLVLDEPTNHLDASTRDALTDALADFDGALVLVSHDRYLIRATVDQLMWVHDGRLEAFDGDLDDYLKWLVREASASPAGPRANDPGSTSTATGKPLPERTPDGNSPPADSARPGTRVDRREERRQQAEQRQQRAHRLRPLDQALASTERELEEVERQLQRLEARFADPDLYRAPEQAAELARERGQLQSRREALETRWLELGTERESLAGS